MTKILLAILTSLIAGYALGTWVTDDSVGDDNILNSTAASEHLQSLEERLLSVEQLIAEEREARLDLERKLRVLVDEGNGEESGAAAANDNSDDDAAERRPAPRRSRDFVAMMRNFEERRLTSLIDGGFTEDEARRVMQQESEAEFKAMQAAWEAQRNGETMDSFSAMGSSQSLLRTELGEAGYERYLAARGQPTSIQVTRVMGGSPGNDAGLQPGDQIVSYDGERVYNVADLRNLTLQGTPGEDVVIEIDRDGVRMQLNLPRGPVGISGSGASIRSMNWLGGG